MNGEDLNVSLTTDITLILFDLGGVLIELDNFPELVIGSSDIRAQEEFWECWLTSEAVKAFESGKIRFSEFVMKFLNKHQFSISPSTFTSKFEVWPKHVYEGAERLLQRLHPCYQLAVFSNNNEIHWDRIMNGMGLGKYFFRCYSSHLIGNVKPDIEAFHAVVNDLARPPSEILFFDDNAQNVESARAVGMRSERVRGVREIESTLKKYNILS